MNNVLTHPSVDRHVILILELYLLTILKKFPLHGDAIHQDQQLMQYIESDEPFQNRHNRLQWLGRAQDRRWKLNFGQSWGSIQWDLREMIRRGYGGLRGWVWGIKWGQNDWPRILDQRIWIIWYEVGLIVGSKLPMLGPKRWVRFLGNLGPENSMVMLVWR